MHSPTWRSQRGRFAILLLVIASIVTWVHRPSLSAQAILFDDQQYLTENHLVQNPGWASARRFLTEVVTPSTVEGYYQPLNMISLMLDCAMGGDPENLRPFHRTSLAFHAANTVLVTVLLYLLFGRFWVAALVGVVFGVHPMAVEPVAWIGERKTLLAAFFSLSCLVVYVLYVRRPNSTRYFACLALFLLALLSKPTSTPLPLVLLLLDFWPLRRCSMRAVGEKLPFLLLAAASAVLAVVSQRHLDLPGFHALSARQNLLLAFHDLVFYPAHMLWPVQLSPLYPFPENISWSNTSLLAAAVLSSIIVAMLLFSLRWTRAPLTAWLCFFVLLAPTLVNKSYSPSLAWDKYAYLPAAGWLIGLAWLLAVAGSRADHLRRGRRQFQVALGVLALVMIAGEVRATRRYLHVWQNSEQLYRHMLARAPDSEQAHNNLGAELTDQGRLDEALVHLRRAVQLGPHHPEARYNLGRALALKGRLEEAISHLRRGLVINPDYPAAHTALGGALVQTGKLDEGISHYKRAIQLKPDDLAGHHQLGTALARKGDLDAAIVHFERAIELRHSSPQANFSLGLACLQAGRPEKAIAPLRRALQLRPDWADAHAHLGRALMGQGDPDQAIVHFERALETDPGHLISRNALGLLFARQGRYDKAITQYRQALEMRPDYAAAHNNWGIALIGQGKPDEALIHFREAVRLDPAGADGHINLGRALKEQGNMPEAILSYRAALRIQPQDANLHHMLGDLFHRDGRLEEAIVEYNEALRIDPAQEAIRRALALARSAHAPSTSTVPAR